MFETQFSKSTNHDAPQQPSHPLPDIMKLKILNDHLNHLSEKQKAKKNWAQYNTRIMCQFSHSVFSVSPHSRFMSHIFTFISRCFGCEVIVVLEKIYKKGTLCGCLYLSRIVSHDIITEISEYNM